MTAACAQSDVARSASAGSYPDDLQQAPVFKHIGSRGYFWYLLFQLFVVDEVDGTDFNKPHPVRSLILGGDGPWIPNPGHSYVRRARLLRASSG
jgi:hypothetical protein